MITQDDIDEFRPTKEKLTYVCNEFGLVFYRGGSCIGHLGRSEWLGMMSKMASELDKFEHG